MNSSILKEEDIAKLQLENWRYRQVGCSNNEHISLTLQLQASQKRIEQLIIENTISINDVKQECNKKIENKTDQINNKIDQTLLSLNTLVQENQNLVQENQKLKSNLEKSSTEIQSLKKQYLDLIKEHQALKSNVAKNTIDIIENHGSQKLNTDSLQKKIQSLQDKQTNSNEVLKSIINQYDNIEKDLKENGKEKEVFNDKLKNVTNDLESFKIKFEQVYKEQNAFQSRYEREYKSLNYKTIPSKIIDYKYFSIIDDWIDNSINHSFTLLYRASENDFDGFKFHSKCDHKGPTITIIETTDGDIFGGYNSQDWKSEMGYYGDNKCFIFTLINKHAIKPTKYITTKESFIFSYSSSSPSFGDYSIYGDKMGRQIFPLNFIDTTFKGNSTLTPSKYFIIKEYEVYQYL
ncbi:hypothetical protein CYY_005092 [Polysphondylium violaceum]|uniref:TLDc domain-containing protein n=1 Tax=Polysphondylium violaceum TaxID=133409 RepID=A0A8J4UZW4_9MYCE|nr:hypothetical protein CYY_005092 [Polysphondylium violaceum]